jgi:hypothetical protein
MASPQPLRVLHAPVEIAGQMILSSVGQRELGVHATSFAQPHPFRYEPPADIVPTGRLDYLRSAIGAARAHDLVHFYFGRSFLPFQVDVRWLARIGKRVAIEFLGSDVRMPSVEATRNRNTSSARRTRLTKRRSPSPRREVQKVWDQCQRKPEVQHAGGNADHRESPGPLHDREAGREDIDAE